LDIKYPTGKTQLQVKIVDTLLGGEVKLLIIKLFFH